MNEAGSWALSRLLLGRNLSESATQAMAGKAPNDAFQGIVLADEFIRNIEIWIAGEAPLPHEARRLVLADDLLVWFDQNIVTAPDFLDRIRRKPSWRSFMTTLLTDPVIAMSIENRPAGHRNLGRFSALIGLLREGARHDGEALAALRAEADEAQAVAVQDFPTSTTGAEPIAAALPAPNQPVVPDAELKSLRFDKDVERVARKIQRMYADKRYVQLYWLHRNFAVGGRACTAHFRALVSFYAARMLLARNASRSAHDILAELKSDPALFETLTSREHKLFPQVLAQSLVRTGRIAEAVGVFHAVLADEPANPEAIFQYAVLSRFERPDLARACFRKLLGLNPKLRADHQQLIAEFLLDQGDVDTTTTLLARLYNSDVDSADTELGFANVAARVGDLAGWQGHLRAYFARHDLLRPELSGGEIGFAALPVAPAASTAAEGPLVSVIMTSFNAAETLSSAVASVLGQTHGNLELFIVDDCSTDSSREIIRALADADPRVKPVFNQVNSGTYVSKSSAILLARGDYVTFHDSDDWMHPERLKVHLEATAPAHVKASISKWIRMDMTGRSIVRAGGGFLHENPASTFIRREVFGEIGLFDSVRTGADSELLWRMIGAYGNDSVVTVSKPLAVGLHHAASLTQSGATAFDEHRFSPVRLTYWESWVRWQLDTLASGRPMFVPFPLKTRHCQAPAEILVDR